MLLDTPICDFGWKAPEFTLPDPDGTMFTMSQHLGDKGLLIAFICNHCPYVQTLADRLATDTAILMDTGINVLAVMSNDYDEYPSDGPEFMKEFAAQHDFKFPYLVDQTQQVGQAYGAVCTPDFFGFNANGELQFRGRFDDIPRNGDPTGRTPELRNAMQMIADTGAGPRDQIASMGCSIKWR